MADQDRIPPEDDDDDIELMIDEFEGPRGEDDDEDHEHAEVHGFVAKADAEDEGEGEDDDEEDDGPDPNWRDDGIRYDRSGRVTLPHRPSAEHPVARPFDGSDEKPEPRAPQRPRTGKNLVELDRMCRTEVLLRVALTLLSEEIVTRDVTVGLVGAEVNKAGHLAFPVEAFLNACGFARTRPGDPDWRDHYWRPNGKFAIALHDNAKPAELVAKLTNGKRLLVEAFAGHIRPTRSSNEQRILYSVIGRTVTLEQVELGDIVAVAVPRSERTRTLSRGFRGAPLFERTGMRVLLVGRGGHIDGMHTLVK